MLFIQSLAMFTGLATAVYFQAWTGEHCDGDAGGTPTIHGSGSCEEIAGRYSWKAVGDNVKGFYYSGSGCQGLNRTEFHVTDNLCNNINTGYYVYSICVTGELNGGCGF